MKSRLRRERGALQAEGIPSRSVGVCEKAERLHEKVFAAEIARLEGKGKVRGAGVGRVEQRFRPRHAGRDGFADAQRAHAKAGHDRAGGFAPATRMRLTPVSTSAAAMSASARSIMAPAASLPKRACVAATLSGEAVE